MKKIIAIVILLAMVLSLCACSNAKIRSKDAAIQAVKKDRGTDTFICGQMGIRAMDKISYTKSTAEQSEDGWLVTLEGYVIGTNNRGFKGTKLFRFTCLITADRNIYDRNVVEMDFDDL
jgi:hypothetical protein